MREEQKNNTSQKKKNNPKKPWFWPLVYAGFSVAFVGMIWGYNVYVTDDSVKDSEWTEANKDPNSVTIETNAQAESMKYPFKETLLDSVEIVQHYYDMEAPEATREQSLVVFNQTYVMNTGVSLSMNSEPFEVVAAMSGKVEEVNLDPFVGDEIVLSHANGMVTKYRSVTGILVKAGDVVEQGDSLATAAENEWNPTAGVHLQFEVLQDGVLVNPETLLAF
ncbi:stage II sporulation protein Q [Psychrobacillus sp. OK028]|uniref:M23 family metallopeptidase n=1 Tax=Psychrobacillus sp. OK028 TaxID=1884359 RepID=UPI000887BA7B|nr:M23 family metallopeptidase [Psychrobacillus sp. OK028]SDN23242.1 stage II sporulation protein Q [Psychrobacillus sp. OK028]